MKSRNSLSDQEIFWRELFEVQPPALELRTDYPRPPVKSYIRSREILEINPQFSKRLAQLSASPRDLYGIFLSAFAILLLRYTRQENFTIGGLSPDSLRQTKDGRSETFVNPVAIPLDLSEDQQISVLLQNIIETLKRAAANRDFPYRELIRLFGSKSELNRAPLFQVMLVIQNQPNLSEDRPLLREHLTRIDDYLADCDLVITIDQQDGDFRILCDFDAEIFEATSIRQILWNFHTLLNEIVSESQRNISNVSLLSKAEHQRVLNDSLRVTKKYPRGSILTELFEKQVARTPDAIALVFEKRKLTYAQLNDSANRLAHLLKKHGVGPDVLVGICMDRSPELVISILGILKAGGAYLPLDLAYPPDRIQFMLQDARTPVLLTQRNLLDGLPEVSARIFCLDSDWREISTHSAENLSNQVTPDHLAYVIYTSGSTGTPKGVQISHYNVVRLFQATEPWFQFNSDDVWTLFHSYAFDFSVWEIWGALLYGGKVVIIPYLTSRSPEDFYQLLSAEKVTVLNQTPSAFRQLIQTEQMLQDPPDLYLRYVIFGGEALDIQSLKPWFERHGDKSPQLINMYGITETTVHVTYRPLSMKDLGSANGSVIGIPIPDLQVYVLDQNMRSQPIGIPGEMYVAGSGLARGYLNRAELTGKCFLENPFGTAGAEPRLYKTGDLARFLPNGDLEYLGRIDHQVKIRGFRIELGEIESAIRSHGLVKDVVVIVREDVAGDKRLIAYIVPNSMQDSVSDELSRGLKAKLPEYMVPSAFVSMESFPLTPNGKLDLRALPIPEQTRESEQDRSSPRTPAEIALAKICCEILRISKIGVHTNFFEAGGDSILAIQVIARARQNGLQLTAREFFKDPTISALASLSSAGYKIADQGSVRGQSPLTPVQRWFFKQGFPDFNYWNQSLLFEIQESLNTSLLKEAFRLVLQHHDQLRARFHQTPTGWSQTFSGTDLAVPFEYLDVSSVPESDRPTIIEANAVRLQSSLNVSDGPLIRIAYFDFGSKVPGRLFITIHHLAIDGISWRILLEDLETAYLQLQNEHRVELPPKTTPFKNWAEHLVSYSTSSTAQEEQHLWNKILKDSNSQVPIDFETHQKHVNSEAFSRKIKDSLTEEETRLLLQTIPSVMKVGILDILLAALARSLSEWISSDSILIDLEGHGREEIFDDVDLSRTVGWFTSIFPLRLDLSPESDPSKVCRKIKEQIQRIPRHGIGYGILKYLSDEPVAEIKAPLMFNYFGQMDQIVSASSLLKFAKEPSGAWHGPTNPRTHLLEVVAMVMDGRLQMEWIYGEKLHKGETVEKLSSQFLKAIRKMIEQARIPTPKELALSDFPLAEIDSKALDRTLEQFPELEDIYILSPMQRLFYSVDSSQPEVGFEQWQYELVGDLNVEALKQAWEKVVDHHTILRTAFISPIGFDPHQVVVRRVQLPWIELDWQEVAAHQQHDQITSFLESDQNLGFDLTRPPLMRLALIRLDTDRYYLVWSTHHLLIDGWSWPLVWKEISALYVSYAKGKPPKINTASPYRNYIQWLKEHQNTHEEESFWRARLEGMKEPTSLSNLMTAQNDHAKSSNGFGQSQIRISHGVTSALEALARKHQFTLSVILQGVWALLLHRYSLADEVVFGATFSGRPAELRSVESMVGPFVNNLPIRLPIKLRAPLQGWLKEIQAQQFELSLHQHASAEEIQSWSQVPWRFRLFDTLLVFQNYVIEEAAERLGETVRVQNIAAPEKTNYAISLMALPGPELSLRILYRASRFREEKIRNLLLELKTLLESITLKPGQTLAELQAVLPPFTPPPIGLPDTRISKREAYVAPRTEIEQTIARIWQEAFQVDKVGLNDNFFDMGGHSLLMLRVHQQLLKNLNTDLSIVKMFQYPTVSSLAKFLSEAPQERSYSDIQDRARKQKEALAKQRKVLRRSESNA